MTTKTEQAVGEKLAKATGLTPVLGSRGQRSIQIDDRARFLSEQVPAGQRAAPISEPMLFEQPYITGPRFPAPKDLKDYLASSKPDFLYVTPTQIEVFEVTVDNGFTLTPQLKGMSVSGSASKAGIAHKLEQVEKTAEYLIQRYPDHVIVYNIQTVGQVPAHVIEKLRTELVKARALVGSAGGKGSFDIVVRAAETFSIS